MSSVSTVDALMQAHFLGADPRSDEYKAGMRAALQLKLEGKPIQRPHAMGTVQADAFYAGHDDGLRIWRAFQAGTAP